MFGTARATTTYLLQAVLVGRKELERSLKELLKTLCNISLLLTPLSHSDDLMEGRHSMGGGGDFFWGGSSSLEPTCIIVLP